jgi:hypothetical protein
MVTASHDPLSVPEWDTANFEGDSCTAMGDDVWELKIFERERVVFYGSVVRL